MYCLMTREPWLMATSVACAKKVAHPRHIENCSSPLLLSLPHLRFPPFSFCFLLRSLFSLCRRSIKSQQHSELISPMTDVSFPFLSAALDSSLSISARFFTTGLRLLPHLAIILEGEVVGGKIPPLCSALAICHTCNIYISSGADWPSIKCPRHSTRARRCRNQMRKSENESPPPQPAFFLHVILRCW